MDGRSQSNSRLRKTLCQIKPVAIEVIRTRYSDEIRRARSTRGRLQQFGVRTGKEILEESVSQLSSGAGQPTIFKISGDAARICGGCGVALSTCTACQRGLPGQYQSPCGSARPAGFSYHLEGCSKPYRRRRWRQYTGPCSLSEYCGAGSTPASETDFRSAVGTSPRPCGRTSTGLLSGSRMPLSLAQLWMVRTPTSAICAASRADTQDDLFLPTIQKL